MIGKEGGRNVARKKLETLTEQMYYILLSLAGEPRHGYGIMQDVSQRTGGRVNIGAGTLYALLARFEEEGLITLTDIREGRKYYLLTGEGRRILRNEYDRLRRQVADGADALEKEEFS
jgi:DNA-binding PadR family transcriptional regulator